MQTDLVVLEPERFAGSMERTTKTRNTRVVVAQGMRKNPDKLAAKDREEFLLPLYFPFKYLQTIGL